MIGIKVYKMHVKDLKVSTSITDTRGVRNSCRMDAMCSLHGGWWTGRGADSASTGARSSRRFLKVIQQGWKSEKVSKVSTVQSSSACRWC